MNQKLIEKEINNNSCNNHKQNEKNLEISEKQRHKTQKFMGCCKYSAQK
jgi:hypothetical protein